MSNCDEWQSDKSTHVLFLTWILCGKKRRVARGSLMVWTHRDIRGAKRDSTNRRKIRHSRHLATANRRIKRTAERGASGPQMPHPSLWPHIDRGAAYHRRGGAKYSRTCDAHVWRARSIRRHERGIELSKGNTAPYWGKFIFVFSTCFYASLSRWPRERERERAIVARGKSV